MRYAGSRFKLYQRETAYRIYVTDTLRIIAKNTGSYPERRFIDVLTDPIDDGKTPEETVASVIEHLGLEVVR